MNPLLVFLLLALGGLIWTALPFIPAILELYRDVLPLKVPRYYQADTRFFARTFRERIRGEITDLSSRIHSGELELTDGTPLVFLTHEFDVGILARTQAKHLGVPPVAIATKRMSVPEGSVLLSDIYAAEGFDGGEAVTYRALYGDGDVSIGRRSAILRWSHSDREMTVGGESILSGRASAEISLNVGSGSEFKRLYAPSICFGEQSRESPEPPVEIELQQWTEQRMEHGLAVLKEDAEIPARTVVHGSIVCRGRLVLGAGCRVHGSLKGHGILHLLDGARVDGAVVGRRAVVIGRHCTVGGPVISECEIFLREGSRVGTPDRQATISGRTIYAAPGSFAHGTVWARKLGLVTPLVS